MCGFDAPSPWVTVLSHYVRPVPTASALLKAYKFAKIPATGVNGQSLRMQPHGLGYTNAATDSVVTSSLLWTVFPYDRYHSDAIYGGAVSFVQLFAGTTKLT